VQLAGPERGPRRLPRAAERSDTQPSNLHHAREALRQQIGPEALPNVAFVSAIEDAVREVDLAIDCVPDELESKLEIFSLLDRMAPPCTVLATPTTRPSQPHRPRSECAGTILEVENLAVKSERNLSQRGNSTCAQAASFETLSLSSRKTPA